MAPSRAALCCDVARTPIDSARVAIATGLDVMTTSQPPQPAPLRRRRARAERPKRAIILAAGMGWRLGGGAQQPPKSLLRFDDRSLLERHVAVLFSLGVERVDVGVGYRADSVEDEIGRIGAGDRIGTVFNPDFDRGNMVTLWRMSEQLTAGGDVLLMDADVLYDRPLMERLVDSRHESCFLLDRDVEPGDEPVKLCVSEGRLVEFAKRVDPDLRYDFHGESVGFFKLSARVARDLADAAAGYVRRGSLDAFYEDALRDLLLASRGVGFGWEDVTGLPWIEIDFREDVERAQREILPRLLERARRQAGDDPMLPARGGAGDG